MLKKNQNKDFWWRIPDNHANVVHLCRPSFETFLVRWSGNQGRPVPAPVRAGQSGRQIDAPLTNTTPPPPPLLPRFYRVYKIIAGGNSFGTASCFEMLPSCGFHTTVLTVLSPITPPSARSMQLVF